MSLFVVNRYTGEDHEETQLSAQDRLEKLKSEIALRKQKRLKSKSDLTSPERTTSVSETPAKRAKSVTSPKEAFEATPEKKARPNKRLSLDTADSSPSSKKAEPLRDTKKVKRQKTKNKKKLANKQKHKSEGADDSEADVEHLRILPLSSRTKETVSEDIDSDNESGGSEGEGEKEDAQDISGVGDDVGDGEDKDPDAVGGFSILGNFENTDLKPVKRVLPDWLAHPSIIQAELKRRKQTTQDDTVEDTDMKILDTDLQQRLHGNGIHRFFPVQRQFIPVLIKDMKSGIFGGHSGLRPRDICVSAPTGSGKTLAFVLPIVQALKDRVVPHIRAVVVLPVRDLAEQVFTVFRQYCAGTSLKVGLVVGRKTLAVEQATLVKKREHLYHSLVDILVATPGRLVDHINSTPGFDLSHLRFLVIDEADRMMEDIKQDWLATVETAAFTAAPLAYFPLSRTQPGPLTIASAQCSQLPLQKLLFSATLSHNPEKLQQLNLFMPRLLTSIVSETQPHVEPDMQENKEKEEKKEGGAVEESTKPEGGSFVGKYTTPEGLTEYFVESSAAEKPLVVLHFLHNLKFRHVLCFTNSVESTHRLYLLAKMFGDIKVCEFSSRLQGERRKKILKKFSSGKIDLLVCSDAMARGMDVENVKCVISYDHPPYIKTYIHRVGRTARAGRAGTSISLLEKKEIFHFKQMMREAGKWSRIREMKVGRQALRPLVEPFQQALGKLPTILKGEKKK